VHMNPPAPKVQQVGGQGPTPVAALATPALPGGPTAEVLVSCLLEAHGSGTWLVNARDVKHLPGRPMTGKLDADWLCKVAGRQLIRPGCAPRPRSGSCEPGLMKIFTSCEDRGTPLRMGPAG
jgi:hypothetical protein